MSDTLSGNKDKALEFNVIVPTGVPATTGGDRGGGVQHSGVISRVLFGSVSPAKTTVASLQEQVEKLSGVVDILVKQVTPKLDQGFRFKEIEVALALSAEGTIGFATAGVEATFTLKFEHA